MHALGLFLEDPYVDALAVPIAAIEVCYGLLCVLLVLELHVSVALRLAVAVGDELCGDEARMKPGNGYI